MKKVLSLLLLLAIVTLQAHAQRYGTRTGTITFHSETPLETIHAVNHAARGVIDADSKKVQFAVLIKGFQFKKALMQEHFNENYMESSKFPKAVFKGEIVEGDPDFHQPGPYDVVVAGKLTIHGVTHDVKVPGTIAMSKAGAQINASFTVKPADYGIKIPALVKNKIAKEIKVTVDALLPMLQKK